MTSDSQLQNSVLEQFKWDSSIPEGHIGVTANAGVVTLSGHVDSYAQKHAAETAVRRVRGVKAIAEEIEVRLPMDSARTDTEIAAAVLERLSWNVSVPKDRIKVVVSQGWVTLTGEVDWWYQKEAIERDIRPLHGVTGVSNQTTIKPLVTTASLSDDITHALQRLWFFDASTIKVHSQGGKVILTGTVHSFHERQLAGLSALSAPGTTSVENNIEVL
jgi:osmotically-inducible protein OsmY